MALILAVQVVSTQQVEGSPCPSGLGFLPDGRLLVVLMQTRKLAMVEASLGSTALTEVADLSANEGCQCNDMCVDVRGGAYVGGFGFNIEDGPEAIRRTNISYCNVQTGAASVVASDATFPNGTVITPDGKTLIAAETFAHQLRAWDR